VHDVLRAPGAPLDRDTRNLMEERLGSDLSDVRVHTDERAAASARAVNALAYTVGRSIAFDRGRYAPQQPAGRELLVHELVHTIQQANAGPPTNAQRLKIGVPDRAEESEARDIATATPMAAQKRPPRRGAVRPGTVQRASAGEEAQPATADGLIARHSSWLFGLDENRLGTELATLAPSVTNHHVIIDALSKLSADDGAQVAGAMAGRLDNEKLKPIAVSESGRAMLTALQPLLPQRSPAWTRVGAAIKAGHQEEREAERMQKGEDLWRTGATRDTTIYTEYEGQDPDEAKLKDYATTRKARHLTDDTFPMATFEDIGPHLQTVAGTRNYVRHLHLMGHGATGWFGFGRFLYSADNLAQIPTGMYAEFMADGGIVELEGCDVAQGPQGVRYMAEIGRIFFGDAKTGYVRGSTCKARRGVLEFEQCDPQTFRWPGDLRPILNALGALRTLLSPPSNTSSSSGQ
jgi:hypothetical protein